MTPRLGAKGMQICRPLSAAQKRTAKVFEHLSRSNQNPINRGSNHGYIEVYSRAQGATGRQAAKEP